METAVVVVVVVRLDGGSSSPLDARLFLALTYAAVAYSPYGVVAMGGVMTLSYLFLVELPEVTSSGLFVMVLMGSFNLVCAMASGNTWATHDRQIALIRQQEALAAIDALTGVPNRQAFLDRVTAAVGDAAGDAVLQAVGERLRERGAGDRHRGPAGGG